MYIVHQLVSKVSIMTKRVNINIPNALFIKSNELIKKGMFSNFSELVREGLRKEVMLYEKEKSFLSIEEKKLFKLLQDAESNNLLINEEEMKMNGLSL